MTDERPEPEGGADGPAVRCDQCGREVPALRWCIRCGDPLGPELRRGRSGRVRDAYAAASEEPARAVRLVSTLYPALPREEIRTFQVALVLGAVLVAGLALAGFFPVATLAAAILVPLLTLLYLYDVDTYEDTPAAVVACTVLWGIVVGVGVTLALDALDPVTLADSVAIGALGGSAAPPFPWLRTVVAPLVAGALVLAGPLVLLRRPRFNDALDGATFGVAAAVAFTGAQTIATSVGLFSSGLRPSAPDVLPWVVRLLGLGIATPVIAAGAIGALAAVLWLRYRPPAGGTVAVGPLGNPALAALLAAALLLAAPLIATVVADEQTLGQLLRLLLLAAAAAVALLWLRRMIHAGLIQESLEIPVGAPAPCASCGEATPRHTFCGACGVALRALPKGRTAAGAGPEPASAGWLGPRRLLVVFAVVLSAATVAGLVVAWIVSQGLDRPACPDPGVPCAGIVRPAGTTAAPAPAIPDGEPFPDLATHTDAATGVRLDYDPGIWEVQTAEPGFVSLVGFGGAILYFADFAGPDGPRDQELFEGRRDAFRGFLLGFEKDRNPERRLLGTSILGHRPGLGALFGGVIDSGQGPELEVAVAIVGATDGTATAVTSVLVAAADRMAGFGLADTLNNSLRWPADEVTE